MTLPKSGLDPIELSRWQGRVDATLASLDVRMSSIETKVDTLPLKIETRMEKVMENQNSRRITFQWVVEKVALPLIVGGVSAAGTILALAKTLH
jgi:ABC-type molybdate transport system permease subunit